MTGKRFATVEEVKQKSLEGLKNLKNVLNNGRIVCRSALWSRENTLKVIKILCKNIKKYRSYDEIPVFFGSPLVRRGYCSLRY